MGVLQNLDLLELILSYLVMPNMRYCKFGDSLSKRGRQRLLLAGIICKAFFEPVMNFLWYQMESFLPLLLAMALVAKIDGIYVRAYDNSFHSTTHLFP